MLPYNGREVSPISSDQCAFAANIRSAPVHFYDKALAAEKPRHPARFTGMLYLRLRSGPGEEQLGIRGQCAA